MLREISGDTRGGISILSALAIVSVIGFSALALEYGYGLLQQVENQRVADVAAYSGALVYNSTGSSSSTNTAVGKIASLNGLTSSAASSSVGSSPSGDGNQAVQVTVTTNAPLLLARVLTTKTTMPVAATASAEINANAPGCVIALSGSGSGISLSGTGSITANNCQVESNTTICANSGANPSDKITTKYLSYGSGTNPASSNCTISPPSGTSSVHISKATASDPLAGNSEVSGATSRISTVASITSPSAPTGGSAVTFKSGSITGSLPSGCTTSSSSSPWAVTCTGAGPFNFAALAVSGGATLTLSSTTSSAVFNISGGISMGGGTTATFGAGTSNIGTLSCSGTNGYSICNAGTSITFNGPNTFVLSGGVYNGGGATMAPGSGSTSNSYNIGKASDGYSINVGTSKIMTLGDATGTGDLFQTAGTISSGGGSCLALPATGEHDSQRQHRCGGRRRDGRGHLHCERLCSLRQRRRRRCVELSDQRDDDRFDGAGRNPGRFRRQHRDVRLYNFGILPRRRLFDRKIDGPDFVLDFGKQYRRSRGGRTPIVGQFRCRLVRQWSVEHTGLRRLLLSQWPSLYERRRHVARHRGFRRLPRADRYPGHRDRWHGGRLDLRRFGERQHRHDDRLGKMNLLRRASGILAASETTASPPSNSLFVRLSY